MREPLTPRRSLDSLKKEAKRWLEALRQRSAEARSRFEQALPDAPETPTLRDVQLALARELGFPGWAALKARLTTAPPPNPALAGYEEMAEALLEAYRTGTPQAMERHWRLTWHRRAWEGMRTYVRLDLGRQAGTAAFEADISLDDARFLVAREHGYPDWAAVVAATASAGATQALTLRKPVRLAAGPDDGPDAAAWSSRDWPSVVARLREGTATGLDAEGQMTDELLGELAAVEQLTTLRLGGSRGLTDEGARHLARLTRLRHLDLSGTGITDRGLEALRSLPDLETLSLAWTAVTDAGITALAHLTRLQRVDLQGTRTGRGALLALSGNPGLRDLRTGIGLTDADPPLLHEFPAFRSGGDEPEELRLLDYDSGPNFLLLRGALTDGGMAHLRGLDGLFGLNLDAAELGLSPRALIPLVDLPRLGRLAVDAMDASMPIIARMPRLRFLSCQDTVAGDAGFAALSRSRSLEYIWGRRCHNLQTAGFTALADIPTLRGIAVSCLNVADAGIARLPEFPALRELMPMDVPDAGYRHIARCPRMDRLTLMYCREASDAAAGHIATLPALRHFFASYNRMTDRSCELLSGMASLESVTFDSCAGLTDAGIQQLTRLPRLRELRVSGPKLTPAAVQGFPSDVRVHFSF